MLLLPYLPAASDAITPSNAHCCQNVLSLTLGLGYDRAHLIPPPFPKYLLLCIQYFGL